ncbi:MAG: Lrp/AsnC family transcriptional regulator [Lachnospiraceae bacterium]|jgi:DNA-binding Lrp family transcriptional regulator|nr:Lrp/AsnC family transcriptional regulator [Lachnospiraceae bacterium]MCH4029821.1 Lrp/AsnC family transcriptional regulator [Lachnospiraceae bacterium]MCH4067327.1 Lrp/AsnC family transcriptional regulator [Lachnospiraceae bacterium]MCH4113351.1 Lrp/AsnC family transcriptional regulator [Lachnospiraceae bacterium]MCI1353992.1 Lrp/AsnC family transcriptional regulator [Lachnospiraceae bacterium]
MFLDNLDLYDQKIIRLLIENSRYTYSEIGDKLGISRVAVKNRIAALEENGIIEEYTAIINPQKIGGSVSCYFEIDTRPDTFQEVIQQLENSAVVTQIYRTTGACHLHVHAVAASQEEMESFLKDVIDQLPGIEKITTNVILSRIKDVKGLRL